MTKPVAELHASSQRKTLLAYGLAYSHLGVGLLSLTSLRSRAKLIVKELTVREQAQSAND